MREHPLGLQVPDDIDDLLIDDAIVHYGDWHWKVDRIRERIQGLLEEWDKWTEREKAAAKLVAKLYSGDAFTLDDLLRPLLTTPMETGYDGHITIFCIARQGTPPRGMVIVDVSHREAWYISHTDKNIRYHILNATVETFVNLVKERNNVQV